MSWYIKSKKIQNTSKKNKKLYTNVFRVMMRQSSIEDWRLQRYMTPEIWEEFQKVKTEYAKVIDEWISLVDREESGQSGTWKRKLEIVTRRMKTLDKRLSQLKKDAEEKVIQENEQDRRDEQKEKAQTENNYNRAKRMGTDLEREARKFFGTTESPELAGFILDDGDMLSLSYDGRMRDMDHREVGEIMLRHNLNTGTDGMKQFMIATNAIRMHLNHGYAGFDIPGQPTRSQVNRMLNIIKTISSDFGVTYQGKAYSFYVDDLEEFLDLINYNY